MSPLDLARQVLARGHEGTEAHTLARALVVACLRIDWHIANGEMMAAWISQSPEKFAEHKPKREAIEAELRAMGEEP